MIKSGVRLLGKGFLPFVTGMRYCALLVVSGVFAGLDLSEKSLSFFAVHPSLSIVK